MRVSQLWRYPIKSMVGEQLRTADVGELGIAGDRQWALVDLDTGLVLTARRVPALLHAVPVPGDDGTMRIRLPDGSLTADDGELSRWLDRPVELRRPAADERGEYEIADNDDRPEGAWSRWQGPEGVWHDSGRTRLSIIAEQALDDWDVRRFRPNVVVTGGDERDLVGHDVRIGGVTLQIVKEIDRCVIVTRPQPGLERDKTVLQRVHTDRGGSLGAGALVRSPGHVTVGDSVEVLG